MKMFKHRVRHERPHRPLKILAVLSAISGKAGGAPAGLPARRRRYHLFDFQIDCFNWQVPMREQDLEAALLLFLIARLIGEQLLL